jgi:formamidopyrimidine-DNA glycosylase
MPELPDIVLYIEHLSARLVGRPLERSRIRSLNLLRTAEPPLEAAAGRTVRSLGRMGKRIVMSFEDQLHFVFHLMIAGRFRWKDPGASIPAKIGLAAFDFPNGTLILTEASSAPARLAARGPGSDRAVDARSGRARGARGVARGVPRRVAASRTTRSSAR